jgi:hypothetical protein
MTPPLIGDCRKVAMALAVSSDQPRYLSSKLSTVGFIADHARREGRPVREFRLT